MIKKKTENGFLFSKILLLLVLSFQFALHAQITITQIDFLKIFSPGSMFYAEETENVLINVGKTGGPNVYDFTNLNIQNLTTFNNYEVSQIQALSTRYPLDATIFGEGSQNIVGNPIFLTRNDSLYFIGEATIANKYEFVHYSPYWLFAHFPMTYPASSSQQINLYDTSYDFSMQVLSTSYSDETVNTRIDGYGTLKLPNLTLECLRIKREYSSSQNKDFLFFTKEGVLFTIVDIPTSDSDTGFVIADYQFFISSNSVGIEEKKNLIQRFDLEQNYPNPFNSLTTIRFTVPKESFVTIKVYDILGSIVATLVNEIKQTGNYNLKFDAAELSSGIYLYQMGAGNYTETKKLILLK